ncbi:MAG: pimeloyl-ACP methyl ester carboxylesterase [Parvicellaceae bacterium]|jgi:pimeloyl-ACP methyl ester carboxylesterase
MNLEELIYTYSNDQSKWIEVLGVNVHYRDEGSGPVLLLIHGTFSSLHTYDEWTAILKKHFRIIRLDMPGFGLTGPNPSDQYSIELFTDFFKDFLDQLNVKECSVVGNSLGGWLAWEYALSDQDRVKKLILLDAAGYINDNNYPLPFVIAQTPVLRNVFNFIPKAVVRRFVRQVFYDQSKVTDEVIERYYNLIHRVGNKEAFVRIANTRYKQNTHNLKDLNIPVLVQWGEEDKWLDVEHAHKFQEDIPDCQLIIYKDVGHIPMEEIPEESAADAFQFLS